jgi:hypothetical protein
MPEQSPDYMAGYRDGHQAALRQFVHHRFVAFNLDELEQLEELLQFTVPEDLWLEIQREIERRKGEKQS